MNPVLPIKLFFLYVLSLIFLQHDGDLFTLEMSEDKLNQLPDGMWKKLAVVCVVVFALSIPKFIKLLISLPQFQITGRRSEFLCY